MLAPSSDVDIAPEARLRMKGREALVSRVCEVAEGIAHGRGLPTSGIRVRPAWSHEYDDATGIVVEITLQASSEARFAYWEALGQAVDALAISLPPEQLRFLNADVSLIVKRV